MSDITATVALNLTEQIILDYRSVLEQAIATFPLRLLDMTWDAEKSLALFEVQYDEGESDLDRNLVDRIIEVIEPVLPSEAIDELTYPEVHDNELGTFYWDEPLWWEARPELPAPYDDIPFHLVVENFSEDVQPLLALARVVFASLAEHDARWREMIVRELFDIFNKTWNKGEPRTVEQFLADISLSSINFYPEGLLRAYYGAGDLFWEHDIELTIDADGSFTAGLIG